jgi:hypothetical protein
MERESDNIGRYAIWMGYSEQLLFAPRPGVIPDETPAKRDVATSNDTKRRPAFLPGEAIAAALALTVLIAGSSLVLKLLRRP